MSAGVVLASVAKAGKGRSVSMAVGRLRIGGAGGLPRQLQMRLYTSSSSPPPPGKASSEDTHHLPLDFSNTEAAYRDRSFKEVVRTYLVYKSFTFNALVKNAQKVSC